MIVGNGSITRTYLADAGDDIIGCSPYVGLIGGNPTAIDGLAPYSYSWEPSALLDNANIANPTISSGITSDQTFEVVVTDANGCIDKDEITVFVNDPSPTAPLGALTNSNGHLELIDGNGNPQGWDAHIVTNENSNAGSIFFIDELQPTDLISSPTSVSDPAAESGCLGASFELENGFISNPTYFSNDEISHPIGPNEVYVVEAKMKFDYAPFIYSGNEHLQIDLVSELSAGTVNRQWSNIKNYDLTPNQFNNIEPGVWASYKACFTKDSYYPTGELKSFAVRLKSNVGTSTLITPTVDFLSIKPITDLIEPITGLNYQMQLFPDANTLVHHVPNGAGASWFVSDNFINSSDFPNAEFEYNKVYLFKQRLDDEPKWNSLTRYRYDDQADVVMNGTLVLEPYVHLNFINSGTIILGETGRMCFGHGSELVLYPGNIFKYHGGTIDFNQKNACIGMFGGNLEISNDKTLDFTGGLFYLQRNSRVMLEQNAKMIFGRKSRWMYESGSHVKTWDRKFRSF